MYVDLSHCLCPDTKEDGGFKFACPLHTRELHAPLTAM